MTKFLPELLSIVTDAQLKTTHVKLKQEYTQYTPSHNFKNYLATNSVAMEITCTYVIYLLDKKDYRTLVTVLPVLANSCQSNEGHAFPEGFLHVLITGLSSRIEHIKENILQAVLREFFVACVHDSETVLLYLCRLLWATHHKIKSSLLNEILEEMEPGEMVGGVAWERW